jgi:hypothetical protein
MIIHKNAFGTIEVKVKLSALLIALCLLIRLVG